MVALELVSSSNDYVTCVSDVLGILPACTVNVIDDFRNRNSCVLSQSSDGDSDNDVIVNASVYLQNQTLTDSLMSDDYLSDIEFPDDAILIQTLLDCGANRTCFISICYFSTYTCTPGRFVYLANGSKVKICGDGDVTLTCGLVIPMCIHVPSFTRNLISLADLCRACSPNKYTGDESSHTIPLPDYCTPFTHLTARSSQILLKYDPKEFRGMNTLFRVLLTLDS